MPELTPRQKEILDLVAAGLTSKEIAARLGLSVHTVRQHRKRMLEKFNVSNAAELVAKTIASKPKDPLQDQYDGFANTSYRR
jgi:DNA-binding CsgD family transcriptional regulator